MNKDEIRNKAYQRMTAIEDRCGAYVNPDAQAYWLLNFLIAEGFSSFFSSYGLLPIHRGDAGDGKENLRLGPLSAFEVDTLNLLNKKIQEQEELYERRKQIQLITHRQVER